MTKEESQMMKGVAILLMLFLHLFNQLPNVELCHNLIYIDGQPLVYILSRATNPVSFFLILDGYGLYKVNLRGDRHRWSRIAKLYIHYWLILLIFVGIGHFMMPGRYPGDFTKILENFTSFHTTYNGEMWFLLPYVILSLLAPYIFKLINRCKSWQVVTATLFIHLCTSYCISRYGEKYLFNNMWIYNPLLVLHLLFSFSLGAVAAKAHIFERLKKLLGKHRHTNFFSVGVIVLVTISCIFKYNFFYAFLIICCINLLPIKGAVRNILCRLGDNSMNMWMIHTWFCYYLFHNFIYSFKYPLLIFAVLTVVSYISSLIVNSVAKPVEVKILGNAQTKSKPVL